MSRRHRAAVAAVVALCAVVAGCSRPGPVADTSPSDPLTRTFRKADRPAAPDISGGTLDGRTVRLSDYRGKVVLLNAWASTCGPCRVEAPELRRIQRAWKDRGVQVLGLDTDQNRGDGLAFQRDFRLGYPSLHDPAGRQALKLPRGLVNAQAIPFTVVVDPAGRIAAARSGQVTEAEVVKLIEPLLPAAREKASRS
ncbi:hypothetical protein GCM10010503_10670 [Streptomyces lucensis JCM 4490]|uniref:Thioredoxin domain-containing protein n=1 Tax=Streptomyces lucensis JCM 4490 TaxID=1306176 RepID=A0A918IX96_9ACTN|nr:TlpA disulfide reductase family protein [Streptomyces lucensis]GGW36625.1 hypothetical protein GCM10010503_10670 [Streptomyces lucensis JCM 4490]